MIGNEKLYKFIISTSTGAKIRTPKNNGPHLFRKEITFMVDIIIDCFLGMSLHGLLGGFPLVGLIATISLVHDLDVVWVVLIPFEYV